MDEAFLAFNLSPEQMDGLWAQGWRHFGPYFFRYSRLRSNHVLPLRMVLKQFQPSKSQLRAIRRNQDLEAVFAPAYVDCEVEDLFERHKSRFTHHVPPDIYTFVSDRPAQIPCPCLCLTLRHQERLVGISYLDVGQISTSSIYQCFDPEYSKRSLGVCMILLSIRYSLESGKAFYYPGYAYQEPSEYDYKKRLGSLEAYDW